MEADAQGYDELSKPQIESGRKFIRELKLSDGAKVLDMGCGTGNVTKYIADIVGSNGEVIGIDPDAARIKIANENYKDAQHLQFHVGNSFGFPHDSEEYYDMQISTLAFHWFPHDQKKLYIRKAHQSLKLGGTLAIMCGDQAADDDDKGDYEAIGLRPLGLDGYQQLFQDVGLFSNVAIKKVVDTAHFETCEIFKRWVKASSHKDLDDVEPALLKKTLDKLVTFHDDGSVTSLLPLLYITATKD